MSDLVARVTGRVRELARRAVGSQLQLARTALRLAPRASLVLAVIVCLSGLLPQGFNLAIGGLVAAVLQAVRLHQPLVASVLPALAIVVGLYWLQQTVTALRIALARYLERTVDNRLRLQMSAAVAHEPSLAFFDADEATQAVAALKFATWSPGYAIRFLCNVLATRITALAALLIIASQLSIVVALVVAATWLAVRRPFRAAYATSVRTVTREASTLKRTRYLL